MAGGPRVALRATVAAWVLVVVAAVAGCASYAPNYLSRDVAASTSLLAPPPADDSPQTRREIEQMLQLQQSRSDEDEARVRSEVWISAKGFYSGVLGESFDSRRLPMTFELLHKVRQDVRAVTNRHKRWWDRPRPPRVDPRIGPCIGLPGNKSYPSGHASSATAWALVLEDLFPDRKSEILARARQIGQDRVIGGVHYPSDVEAGETLAAILVEKMKSDPHFTTDLQQAQREVAALRDEN